MQLLRKKKDNETNLKHEIENIEANLITLIDLKDIEETHNILVDKKQALNEIIDKRINGIIVRAKALKVEYNEKNTKYFSNLEKKQTERKSISQLNIKGKVVTKQSDILKSEADFYTNLYKEKDQSENESVYNFFNQNMTKLNDNELNQCEGMLTEYECGIALKQMQNNKSPGSDGITTEFFKVFWNTIKTFLVNSLNYSFQNKNLTDLQKQSVITLLPKSGKNTTNLDNWRPISLLNVDYKIAAKSIANRIKPVLPSIISPAQTGFIKGRYIGENIRLLFETLDNIENANSPAILFFSDFEKAFDSLNQSYIFNCLEHFNFGQSLISWVKLFYSDAQSCVINNGYLSDFFPIKCGVRQGCPLSPYLFILCIELLSYEISHNNNIKGVDLDGCEVKETLFADDATFFTDGSKQSFESLIDVLDNFKYISGLKLNHLKCTALKAGSLKTSKYTYCKNKKFKWCNDSAKTLGVTFHTENKNIYALNLEPKIKEFNNCLKSWQHRKLTLMGKITVLKSFALPKLVYPLSVLPNPPEDKIKYIINKMYNFLWDGKPDKVQRNTIIQNYKNGGLKMIDLRFFMNALKCSWIKRILNVENKGMWKQFYLNKLKKYGGNMLFNCNI